MQNPPTFSKSVQDTVKGEERGLPNRDISTAVVSLRARQGNSVCTESG